MLTVSLVILNHSVKNVSSEFGFHFPMRRVMNTALQTSYKYTLSLGFHPEHTVEQVLVCRAYQCSSNRSILYGICSEANTALLAFEI
jgi:hypothetical protein